MELVDYLPIVVMFVLAAAFAGVSLVVSYFLSYKRPTAEKLAPYECGIVTEEEPLHRFPVKFYLVAILFVIFDVEIIFLFAWASVWQDLGWFGVAAAQSAYYLYMSLVEAYVARLKEEPGEDIWLFGGGALFRTLVDAGLAQIAAALRAWSTDARVTVEARYGGDEPRTVTYE